MVVGGRNTRVDPLDPLGSPPPPRSCRENTPEGDYGVIRTLNVLRRYDPVKINRRVAGTGSSPVCEQTYLRPNARLRRSETSPRGLRRTPRVPTNVLSPGRGPDPCRSGPLESECLQTSPETNRTCTRGEGYDAALTTEGGGGTVVAVPTTSSTFSLSVGRGQWHPRRLWTQEVSAVTEVLCTTGVSSDETSTTPWDQSSRWERTQRLASLRFPSRAVGEVFSDVTTNIQSRRTGDFNEVFGLILGSFLFRVEVEGYEGKDMGLGRSEWGRPHGTGVYTSRDLSCLPTGV